MFGIFGDGEGEGEGGEGGGELLKNEGNALKNQKMWGKPMQKIKGAGDVLSKIDELSRFCAILGVDNMYAETIFRRSFFEKLMIWVDAVQL